MHRKCARLRFYAELNDFLPSARRFADVEFEFDVSPSVKDMIEAAGVPHPEVDVIVVNGNSVDFSYRVRDGDRVGVFPVFESLDVSPIVRLRPDPLRIPRFVVDANLGGLVRHLRLLGIDSEFAADSADEEIARVAEEEKRALLTRDVGLLKRSSVTRGYFVRATNPLEQTAEVVNRFDLITSISPFARCMECNGVLEPVDKASVAGRIPIGVGRRYEDFGSCPRCGRVYWEGTHHARLAAVVDQVLSLASRRASERS